MALAATWSNLAIVRASWTKRLWLAAAGIAIFIATVWTARALRPSAEPDGSGFGLDFIAFYTAGNFVDHGRLGDLYDLDAVHQFQRELAAANHFDLGRAYGPWWNPPFYALAFAPLARLPYPAASATWIGLNLICFAVACVLMRRILPRQTHWQTSTLLPVLAVVSAPFILAVSHAQNTCTSLLLLALTVTLWRARRPALTGLVGGLMFYKPQVAFVLALVIAMDSGWRAVAGYAITGTILLAINLLTLPGTLTDYFRRLPQNVHAVQTGTAYPWEQHVTLKAFWRLLLQGHSLGDSTVAVWALMILSVAGVCILLVIAAVRVRKTTDSLQRSQSRDRLIAVAIVATPLLMPFYFDYDLLLLALPAVLFAAERMSRDRDVRSAADRWAIASWILLYAWQMVNAEFAGRFHLNLSVVLLACLAWALIARIARTRPVEIRDTNEHPVELARAA